MKNNLILILMLWVVASASAQTVSVEDAMRKAMAIDMRGWTSISCDEDGDAAGAKARVASRELQLAYTGMDGNDTCYYVFNYPQGGFAIVGGDESAAEVLGYCENGSFDINRLPDGLRFMMDVYREQISAGIKERKELASNELVSGNGDRKAVWSRRKDLAAGKRTSIKPLLSTKWGQDDPFNCMIPYFPGYQHFITGCNATAVAQIIKYFDFTNGTGSHSYKGSYNLGGELAELEFSANFEGESYDFANMLDDYAEPHTLVQKMAVGKLMYHCGVAMSMEYGTSASSSWTSAPLDALTKTFGYSPYITMKQRMGDDDSWEDLIYNELKNLRPVMYSGRTVMGGGHGFLIHGYRAEDNMWAVNWGWAGYCDGYFALSGSDALATTSQYNMSQSAIIGIEPYKIGGAEADVVFTIDGTSVMEGKTLSISHTRYYHGDITYTSTNPEIATVDGNGTVTALSAGTATIEVTASATDIYRETKAVFEITVEEKVEDYNNNIGLEEVETGLSTQKKLWVSNTGFDPILITRIVIRDADNESTKVSYSIQSVLDPFSTVGWTFTFSASIENAIYDVYYNYNGKEWVKTTEVPAEDDDDPEADAITKTESETVPPVGVYDVSGSKAASLKSGINIIRYADGTVKKVMKK